MTRRPRRSSVGVTFGDEIFGTGDAAVEAFVIEPADGRFRAGVLFLHWLGEHRSDRTQFLSEAREMARLGVLRRELRLG